MRGRAGLEAKDQLVEACLGVRDDTDYRTSMNLNSVNHVASADRCRARCRKNPACGAWTWGKDPEILGVTRVCFLKRLAAGEVPEEVPKVGVVSGLACRPPGAAGAAEPLPEPCGFEDGVDYVTGKNLMEQHGVTSAEICRAVCRASPGCDAWTWGKRRHTVGVTDMCWMKALKHNFTWTKATKPGVVSGLACIPGTSTFTSTTTTTQTMTTTPTTTQTDTTLTSTTTSVTTLTLTSTTSVTTLSSTSTWTTSTTVASRTAAGHSMANSSREGVRAPSTTALAVVVNSSTAAATTARETSRTTTPLATTLTRTSTDTTLPSTTSRSTTTASTTSSRTTLTTTTPVVPTTTYNYSSETLFCFTLVRPYSFEPDLLAMQRQRRTSLFACDEYSVFSNQTLDGESGLKVDIIDISLECKRGGELKTPLNVKLFAAVWTRVIRDGRFRLYAWTVKVEADTVFLPHRLLYILRDYSDVDAHETRGMYFNNCRFGLQGPLEVFSRNAVLALGEGWHHCRNYFHMQCSGPCWWPEDLFVDQCLSQVQYVKRETDERLLNEEQCKPPKGWRSCKDSFRVAFHPFQTEDEYSECLKNAESQKNSSKPGAFLF